MLINVLENFVDTNDSNNFINVINEYKNKNVLNQVKSGRYLTSRPDGEFELEYLKKYIKKLNLFLKKDLPNFESYYLHEILIARYDVGSFMNVHADDSKGECVDCKYNAIFYFNNDYIGGELFFPKLNKEYLPDKGTAVFYRLGVPELDHGVKEITSGSKYIMAICLTTNKDRTLDQYKVVNDLI